MKVSPFCLYKTILNIAGEPKTVKKMYNTGTILVEVEQETNAKNLLRLEKILEIPVIVTPHKSLNSCRGVIRCRDLKDTSEDEMLDGLKDQGVTSVKRIFITKNGKKIMTGTSILTFNTPKLPSTIKAGYLNANVERFIPNPLRCFKCQKFGHHQSACKNENICGPGKGQPHLHVVPGGNIMYFGT
ncbi:hypothetical protein GQR58_025782 [Nymphon striatum]|nr:hypothetical protein GQR58_025782 [Nymphon striatum]